MSVDPSVPPPVVRDGVRDAVEAAGLDATAAQIDALTHYLQLLQRWNAVYNLTAIRDPGSMLIQHIADSLSLISPLARETAASDIPTPRILDVGSGGGLPAIPLAILRPAWPVTCVEPVGKKTAFLRQAAAECRLANLTALAQRVEALPDGRCYDWVTSRAFGRLSHLVDGTRRLLAPTGGWVAMKGIPPDDELAEVASRVEVFHVEPLHVPGLNAARCLVWMRPGKV